MSSVDNRIVILSFDNKDFEKNVQTSMSTLDKLKNNLDLSQSSKGLTALAASAKSFDLGPMGRAIESIKDRFSGLGIVGMTVLQNLTNTAVDFGKRLVGAMIEPLTSGGWKRALNIEQATFQMEGLLGKTEGGAQKIEAIMASVKESVLGTAYGMDEAARVASQLVATGIEDSQLMLKYLQGVAGAAAMTGSSYDEIGHIFTTVAGNGRLMGDQLQQFAYRGLNVAATLSKQMGITEEEFRKMVTKGKISFEEFADGMAEAFGEHATKANETFTGSLSNMRAALARIGEEFATPALKYFRDIFYSLKLLIDQVHVRLKPLIDLINNQLIGKAGKFVDFIDSITEALGGESQRMKKEAEEAAGATEETAARVTKSSEEIEEAARRIIAGEFGNGIENRREQLAALGLSFEEVQNKVNELLGNEFRYEVQTKEISDASKEAAEKNEELADSTDNVNKQLAKGIFKDFYFSIVNIKTALGQFAKIFKSAIVNSFSGTGILKSISGVSSAFKKFTQSLLLTKNESVGYQKVLEGIFKGIGLVGKGVLKAVEYFLKFLTVISNLKNNLLGFIGSLFNTNEEIDNTSRKAKFLEAFSNVVTKLGDGFTAFKEKVKGVFERVKNTEGFARLQESFTQLWSTLKDIGGKVFDAVIEKLEKFAGVDVSFSWLDGLVGFLGKAAGYLATFISEIANGFPHVKEFFGNFKELGGGKFEKFVGFLKNAKDGISGFVSSFKKEGFSGVFQLIKDGVLGLLSGESVDGSSVASSIIGIIKDTLSGGFESIGEFFKGLSENGLVQGIKDFISRVASKLSGIDVEEVLRILDLVGSIIKKILEYKLLVVLVGKLGGVFDTASNALTTISNSISSLFTSLGDVLKSVKDIADNYAKKMLQIEKTKLIILAIATITAAIFVLSKIPSDDLLRSVESLGMIMLAVLGMFVAIGNIPVSTTKLEGFAKSMTGLGVGLLAISVAAKILSKMPWEVVIDGAKKIAVFAGIMVVASKIAGQVKAGAAFIGLAVALNLLVPAIALLGKMNKSTLSKAAAVIGAVVLELAVASRIAGKVKAAAAFMGLAVALDLLVPAIAILGKLNTKTLIQGAGAIVAIVTSLALACRLASSPEALKGAKALRSLAIPLVAAIVGIEILGHMKFSQMLQGAIALGSIMVAIGAALKLAQGSEASANSMIKIAGVIAVIVLALKILADVPMEQLLVAVISLDSVLVALGASLKMSAGIEASIAPFMTMAIALAGVFAALYFLKDTPWENLLSAAASMGMLMLALGAAMKLANGIDWQAGLGLAIGSASLLVAAFSLKMLTDYDWQSMIGSATAMSELLLAVAVALRIFNGSDFVSTVIGAASFSAGMGIILLAISGLSALLGWFTEIGDGSFLTKVQNGGKVLEAVGEVIGNFIGGLTEGITNSLPDIASNLSQFGENIKPFFSTMADVSGDVLSGIGKLSLAVLILTGSQFLDGIQKLFNGGTSSLAQFGLELFNFGPKFAHFANSVSGIDTSGVGVAAESILALANAAAAIPNEGGILGKIVGNNSLSSFTEQFSNAGLHLKAFAINTQGVSAKDVKEAASALAAVANAAAEIPNQGLSVMSVIFGDNRLDIFTEKLGVAGLQLKSFATNAKGVTYEDVIGPAQALVAVAKAAKEIPNEGLSLASIFKGDNKLSDFGPELASFGTDLKTFATETSGVTLQGVLPAISASAAVFSLAGEVPNTGGILGFLKGNNSLGKFGEELANFGPGLATFATSLQGVSTSKINTLAYAMPSIAEMVNAVNETGYSQLDGFGQALSSFGGYIEDYSNSIADVDPDKLNTVISGMYRLSGLAQSLSGNGDAISSFSDIFKSAGKNSVSEFTNSFADAGDAADAVEGFISSVTPDTSGFEKAFSKAAENAIKSFKDSFSMSQASVRVSVAGFIAYAQSSLAQSAVSFQNTFESVATNAATKFVGGLSGRNYEAYSAGSGLGSSAYNGLANNVGDWYSIGVNCAAGFANGIGNSHALQVAINNAVNLVSQAINAAKRRAREASPSKEFYEIGEYCVLGYANALRDGAKLSAKNSEGLVAETIKQATKQAAALENALNMDFNLDPVITPVLDLSNITAGADQVNSMFGRTPVGLDINNATLMGNLAMMSSGFNTTDTGNEDVVSAINGLKGGLNNMTFNITVDGAENPEDFVDRMVRALKSRSRI